MQADYENGAIGLMVIGVVHERLINVLLRGTTLASKFLLIIFLAKFLDVLEVGMYGLLSAVIIYSIYLVGFELYVYANRLVISQKAYKKDIFVSQILIGTLVYLVLLPFAYLLYQLLGYDGIYFYYLIFIVYFEYLILEVYRYFVATERQLKGSLILFVGSGLWPMLLVLFFMFDEGNRDLESVFFFWLIGSFVGMIYGLFSLEKSSLSFESVKEWGLILVSKGLKITFLYFLAALAFKALFTVDRFIFEYSASLSLLAPYILYMTISLAVLSFIDASVNAFFYPKIINASANGNDHEFKKLFRLNLRDSMLVGLFLSLLVMLVGVFGVDFLDKAEYKTNLIFLPILLLIMLLQAVGVCFQIGLYAKHDDKYIALIKIIMIGVFLILNVLLLPVMSYYAVFISLGLVFLFQAIFYIMRFKQLLKEGY